MREILTESLPKSRKKAWELLVSGGLAWAFANGWVAAVICLGLAIAIVIYDFWQVRCEKNNRPSPIMLPSRSGHLLTRGRISNTSFYFLVCFFGIIMVAALGFCGWRAYLVQLETKPKIRARQYAVWHWRRELDWSRVGIKGTTEYLKPEKWFKSKLKPQFLTAWRKDETKAKKNEQELLSALNNADFKDINDAFEKARASKGGKRRTHDVNWYSLFSGPNNFKAVCEELDLHGHYDVLYGQASTIAHATTLTQMVSHEQDTLIIENIRNLNEMQRLTIYAASEAIFAYRLFLEKYRRGEMPAFQRKYLQEWHKPFHSIPKVEIERGKGIVY